jgi:hypothetical protein
LTAGRRSVAGAAGEEAKTTTSRLARQATGTGGATARTSGRMSARPGEEKKTEATTSRIRGSSASKDGGDIKFGRGRNTSGTREAEVKGVRGTSANKGADVKFGGRDRSTGSRDR